MWTQAGMQFSPLKVWSMAWHEIVYQPGFTKEKSKQLEVLKQGFSCSKFLLRLGEVKLLSCVWLLVIPWTVAPQAPLSIEFSRQEYWSGLPFPPPSFIFHCTCHCRRLSGLTAATWRSRSCSKWLAASQLPLLCLLVMGLDVNHCRTTVLAARRPISPPSLCLPSLLWEHWRNVCFIHPTLPQERAWEM